MTIGDGKISVEAYLTVEVARTLRVSGKDTPVEFRISNVTQKLPSSLGPHQRAYRLALTVPASAFMEASIPTIRMEIPEVRTATFDVSAALYLCDDCALFAHDPDEAAEHFDKVHAPVPTT